MKSTSFERWRDLPGYEGAYMISDLGRLKTFQRGKQGQIMKPYPNATIAARENGVCARNVQQAAKGQRKTAGGYRWRYYGEAAG